MTHAEARQLYREINNAGDGFAIGEEDGPAETAILDEGWEIKDSWDDGLYEAHDEFGTVYLVGYAAGPWAVCCD